MRPAAGRRPLRLVAPLAQERVEVGLRRRRAAGEEHDRRLEVDPVLRPAEPAVEPADQLADVVDAGTGDRVDRVHVAPRPHEQALGHVEVLDQPQGGVAVEVAPAADDHRRDPDQPVVGAQRAPAPERPVVLLLDRAVPGHEVVDPRQPPLPPVVAGQGGHRREGVQRDHRQRVVELDRLADAAGVVDVVGVAVVGRIERDDRPQRRRPEHRGVERREPGIRAPEHPDRARAPGLLGEPRDDGAQVVGLGRRVLVDGDAVRGARAARVDAADRIVALVPKPAVVVGPDRDVVLAIRVRLEDRGPRAGRLGQVQRRGEPHAVAHRDEDVRLRQRAHSVIARRRGLDAIAWAG